MRNKGFAFLIGQEQEPAAPSWDNKAKQQYRVPGLENALHHTHTKKGIKIKSHVEKNPASLNPNLSKQTFVCVKETHHTTETLSPPNKGCWCTSMETVHSTCPDTCSMGWENNPNPAKAPDTVPGPFSPRQLLVFANRPCSFAGRQH